MTQHAGSIANQAGAAFRADLNNLIAALLSANSGTSAPSPTFAFMFWEDTTAALLKQRNSANSAWITIGPAGDLGIQSAAQTVCAAGGTADALTGAFNPAMNTAVNGAPMWVRAGFSNATTTPTFKPDGAVLKTMVKASGALVPGDIAGAGHWLCIQYDSTLDKYMLLNPATGIGVATVTDKIQSITASVAANALTLTVNPTTLDFRNASLSTGTPSTVTITAAQSMVVPSGASLGTTSAKQSRIAVLCLNNGGTGEIAGINLECDTYLDETGLISTTAISAGATSKNTAYSTTARANVPYRLMGFIESTQTIAGTWAAAPSTIQGRGGLAMASLKELGNADTLVNQTGSRAGATLYTNNRRTKRRVEVTASVNVTGAQLNFNINGVSVADFTVPAANYNVNFSKDIPPGATYSVDSPSGTPSVARWWETP